ncbi:cilia- and flagella-associated protein 99-like isoform X3 [Mytilus californianus]|uniref:cilia- and flagella-associated protein 99-like isoform X3 n=1 Tax=Mytilus californianus TaxID=6549 RepID=UPI002248201C|nr:cilia- and flagella-associated protein 99-like isoform X3 [Mytilus californianus]XP_052102293.1 cilia- and flagella-associated protein 99-like isoform X3 [Mytilus californianus]
MTQNHKQLFVHCVQVLNTYNVDTQSVEEHVNRYLKENGIFDESDQTFIVEVFSECVRYSNLMEVVLNGFYNKDGKTTLRSEQNLYHVICYLATFRLDELGMAHFRKFVSSQDINKMYRFLSFFLNERNLLTWIKDGWEKYYEHVFVQTSLLSPLQRWMPEIDDMLSLMKNTIDNRLKPKSRAGSVTETRPFNITQPRPRSIPVPEPIPKLKKHKPAPVTLYDKPVEIEMIQRTKEANRRRAEERLMEASRLQYACANPNKSQKTKEIISNIIYEEESKIDFEKHKANPTPAFLSREVPVKMNTAQILREGKLYQQREEEIIKKLENLEAGAKDASDFLKWQSEMRQKDLESKLADIERRRLGGKLSHEEAIFARQNLIKDNKQKVLEMKEETKQMMQEFLEKKFKEEKEMRNLVEETMQGHKNTKEATKKLKDYKRKIVQEVNEESKELMKQALEEAELEMRRKMELIHQIKAMEAVPIIRQKLVDLSESAGHGLLSEMSIAELRERVSLCKAAEKESEENRRDDILQNKEAKDQLLLNTLETISKHRLEQTRAAATRLETKKKSEPKKIELKDEKLTELQKKLEERKAQRMKEREAAKLGTKRNSADNRTRSLINQKKALEENRWRELELTQERAAKLMDGSLGKSKSASRLASNMVMT